MKHYSHLLRFAIILGLAGCGFLAVRSYLVPESFGVYGNYTYGYHRGASDAEQAALPALYQGSQTCTSCHAAEHATWSSAGHADVSCEACHGHWQAHNANTPDAVIKDSSIQACMVCHGALPARPEDFPQIESLEQHLREQRQELRPDMTCTYCHHPHEPT
jgi:hypothetical protein